MPQTIKLQNGDTLLVPDNYTPEQIQGAVDQHRQLTTSPGDHVRQFASDAWADTKNVASGLLGTAKNVGQFVWDTLPAGVAVRTIGDVARDGFWEGGRKALMGTTDDILSADQTIGNAIKGLPAHYADLAANLPDRLLHQPVSTLIDVAAVADPLLRTGGATAGAAGLTNTAANLTRAANVVDAANPINIAGRATGAAMRGVGRGLDAGSLGLTRGALKVPNATDEAVQFAREQRYVTPARAEAGAEAYVTPRALERDAIQQAEPPVRFTFQGNDLPTLNQLIQEKQAVTAANPAPYKAATRRLEDFLNDPNISSTVSREVPLSADEYQLAIRDVVGPQMRDLTPQELEQLWRQAAQKGSTDLTVLPTKTPWADADYQMAAGGRSDIPVSRTVQERTMDQVPRPKLQDTLQQLDAEVAAAKGYENNPQIPFELRVDLNAKRANATDLRNILGRDAQGNLTRVGELNQEMAPAMQLKQALKNPEAKAAMLPGALTHAVTDFIAPYALYHLTHSPGDVIGYFGAKAAVNSPLARGLASQALWEGGKLTTAAGRSMANPQLALSAAQVSTLDRALVPSVKDEDEEAKRRQLEQALTTGRALTTP